MKEFLPHGIALNPVEREIANDKKPLYLIEILDTSSSMNECSEIVTETGEKKKISKIEQLNQGIKKVLQSLKKFEDENVMYKVYLQIIELNSYGKALFPEFVPIARNVEEIRFEAYGCTCLENSVNTLKRYINRKYMPGYNRAVSVILMSDGHPTDGNGFETTRAAYETIIDEWNEHLTKSDYKRNVETYAIAVGDNADEEMLRYFAGDESHFFRVEESESLADKLDFATRMSLAHHTTMNPETEEENDDEWFGGDADECEENGTEYEIDILKCLKGDCRQCKETCEMGAITVENGIPSVDADFCNGCGKCASVCPTGAIGPKSDSDIDGILGW